MFVLVILSGCGLFSSNRPPSERTICASIDEPLTTVEQVGAMAFGQAKLLGDSNTANPPAITKENFAYPREFNRSVHRIQTMFNPLCTMLVSSGQALLPHLPKGEFGLEPALNDLKGFCGTTDLPKGRDAEAAVLKVQDSLNEVRSRCAELNEGFPDKRITCKAGQDIADKLLEPLLKLEATMPELEASRQSFRAAAAVEPFNAASLKAPLEKLGEVEGHWAIYCNQLNKLIEGHSMRLAKLAELDSARAKLAEFRDRCNALPFNVNQPADPETGAKTQQQIEDLGRLHGELVSSYREAFGSCTR